VKVEAATGLLRGLIGIGGFLLMAFLMSKNKKKINWKLVGCGLLLQIVIGALVLNPVVKTKVFDPVDRFVQSLLDFSKKGSDFVMQSVEPHDVYEYVKVERDGKMVDEPVRKFCVGRTSPGSKTFAFWILPTVVFFSSIMTLLYFFGVMQPIVRIIAKVVQKVMGTSGSETTSCSANIFMGQTEAPLVVKPFIATMTRSELHAVMVGGFATVAGGVLAMYAAILQSIPGIAGHLVTASCMAAPGALYISKIIYPETEESDTMGDLKIEIEKVDSNAVEAAARGASEGMQLLINIVAMLIAFVALVAMADGFVSWLTGLFMANPVTFTDILGWFFYPFAMLMGVPTADCSAVGEMLGKKVVLTELLAYLDLSNRVVAGSLSLKAQIICSYALCGFANFASIGIQIGGISAIAPQRRKDLAELGFSAMCAGVLVTCITGTIAGVFMSLGY
jgi:CNT family concentrative nucleoside transporter